MKKIILLLVLFFLAPAVWAEEKYFVEGSVDDQDFVINGVQFESRSYCPGFQMGDQVFFLDGAPDGNCTEALIVDQRTNVSCDVWCQYPL